MCGAALTISSLAPTSIAIGSRSSGTVGAPRWARCTWPWSWRFKAAVLVVGGFFISRAMPEVEAINFAPRVQIPVLMLNGRYDFFLPEDGTQIPMFRSLTPPTAEAPRRL